MLMKQLKEFKDLYHETAKRKEVTISYMKDEKHRLEDLNKGLEDELVKLKHKFGDTEGNLKMAAMEVLGLRKRIEKMKYMSLKNVFY